MVIASIEFGDLLFADHAKSKQKIAAAGKGCHTPYGGSQ